ncbi:hypothetical protein BC781_1037 [Sediminitomix flava]|uniref:Uncharacterized protein n=1 Tax=Sediminitomix flava TaxID=379075 RepID=A0A315ZWQ3_SEDFL|nr:hypothetical protein BC781_1037 [Sediminitomix flava]
MSRLNLFDFLILVSINNFEICHLLIKLTEIPVLHIKSIYEYKVKPNLETSLNLDLGVL